MCYSRLLSQRDYEDFKNLFVQLDILKYVQYGTFGDIIEEDYNSVRFDLRECVTEVLLNNK